MIATQNTNLNVVPGGIIPVVHVSQYDTGREISFTLYDGNAPAVIDSETVVSIEGTKPDGHGFSHEGTLVDNVVTFETTEQMTVLTGGIECKLKLVLGSQVIGTAMFILDVEKAGIDDNTIVSDTELPMIIALAQEQEANAAASAAEAEAQALKSEGNAVGTQNGAAVSEESPYYHNNSRYWCTQAQAIATGDIPEMIGSTPTADGMHGLVPTPHIGDERKALMGSGTWGNVDSGTVLTYAEWLLLTPEEKAVGDYFITNYPANGSFAPIGGFDTTPTLNSFVPVTSDGIARAIQPLSGSIQSISGSVQTISGKIGTTDISSIGQTITGAIKNLAPTDEVNYSRGDSTTIPASRWTVFGNSGKVFSKGLWIIIGSSYIYGGGVNDKYIRLTLYKSNGTSITNSNIHIATSALEGSTTQVCYVPEDSCYCLLDVYNYSNSATVNGCSIKGIKLRD